MNGTTLKVAVVGCGQIADAHLQEIRKIRSAAVVAVCDRYVDLARQAAARFEVPGVYEDLDQMLREVRPDVVHITTPPQSHAPIAIAAIAAGAHVYVEKPFTVDVAETDRVLASASEHRRLVCVGHDNLFDPVWERCRSIIAAGEIGDVLHVDSVQGYDLSGPFGKAFASEPEHWVHRLPGKLFQNVMSHAMYRITDLMPDPDPQIWATWFGRKPGLPTELRVMLRGRQSTAHLIFSSEIRPVRRVATIHGSKQVIEVDMDGRTIRRSTGLRWPGAFAKIEAPFRHWREASRSLRSSIGKFLRNEIQYFGGMNRLFTLFYNAIQHGHQPPIAPQEIRRVTFLMDQIFRACAAADSDIIDHKQTFEDSPLAPLPQGSAA